MKYQKKISPKMTDTCYCCKKIIDPESDDIIWSYICGIYKCDDCIGGDCSCCFEFVGNTNNNDECERCARKGKFWEQNKH